MSFQQLASKWQQFAPARIQPQATTLARKDGHAELAFHLCQRHAGRGLAETELVGCGTHAAVQCHPHKDFELAWADIHHQNILYYRLIIRSFVD